MLTTKAKMRLARVAYHGVSLVNRLAGRVDQVEVTRGGIRWDLDLREGIDLAIYLMGAFEPRVARACAALIPRGGVVLDVGANIGAHALPFARAVGASGRVIAFEPTQYAFGKLRANLDLNPKLREIVTAEQIMLVDGTGGAPSADLYSSWPVVADDGVHEKLRGRLETTTGAQACTLDSYVARAGFDRLDLIKIDVDGFECSVLRGASDTLRRLRPPIAIELMPYGLNEQGESLENLLDAMSAVGYRLRALPSGRALPADAGSLAGMIPDGAGIMALATIE